MALSGEVHHRYELARRIAHEAARLSLRIFNQGIQVDRKSDTSPVTEADRQAETYLRDAVLQAFPQDGIVGEEWGTVDGKSPYRWIFDPIDGTKSFIQGVPLYGTMVGVEFESRCVIGAIALPGLNVQIDAAQGQGAWETKADGSRVPARVCETERIRDGLVVTTDLEGFIENHALPQLAKLDQEAWFLRTWGDCYGYYLVATGRALAMVDPRLKIWDAAALQPILEEAGGRFTDWQGIDTIHSGNAVGSNGYVHDEVLEILRGIGHCG